MYRGNETALKDKQEEQGPMWLCDGPKDQKELGRMQRKKGTLVGLG
jgi:hypothetical protein